MATTSTTRRGQNWFEHQASDEDRHHLERLRGQLRTAPADPMLFRNQAESARLLELLKEEYSLVFDKVVGGVMFSSETTVHDLIEDPCGSCLFVALLDAGSIDHKKVLVEWATKNARRLAAVAGTSPGSDCIKNMIISVRNIPGLSTLIANALAAFAEPVMKTPEGKNILSCCFHNWGYEPTNVIAQAIAQHFVKLAKHPEGRWSLIFCLQRAQGPIRSEMLSIALRHRLQLARHDYGADVILQLFENESSDESITPEIFFTIREHVVTVSMSRGGSRVVIRLLTLRPYGESLCWRIKHLEVRVLARMAQDKYGSRVLEHALDCFEGEPMYLVLLGAIARVPANLIEGRHARHLYHLATSVLSAC